MTKILCAWLCLACLTLSACTLDRSRYSYLPSAKLEQAGKPLPVTLAVDYLQDARGNGNENRLFLIWLPLVPYASSRYERPESDEKFAFKGLKPSQDFALAAMQEIEQNNLFSRVVLLPEHRDAKADLILSGRIDTADLKVNATCYCASWFGMLPWLIGFPQGKVYNELAVRYEIRRASDHALLWSHQVKGDWHMLFGMYYNYRKDEPYTGFNQILQKGLHEGVAQLAKEIRSNPAAFTPRKAP